MQQSDAAVGIFDIISFAVTIGLGVVSLVLGAFAIWLSRHFDARSTLALQSIRDLAGDLQATVKVAVAQQETFSTKMLDSILRRDQYAVPVVTEGAQDPEQLTHVIDTKLAASEERLVARFEEQLRNLSTGSGSDARAIASAVKEVREELKSFRERAASAITSPIDLPPEIKLQLTRWQRVPAYLVLLYGAIRSGASSTKDLTAIAGDFGFPTPIDSPVRTLLSKGFLQGTPTSFAISERIQSHLTEWANLNEPTLRELSELFRKSERRLGGPESARQVAEKLII